LELEIGVGVFCAEKRGWVGEEKRLFYFGDFSRYSPGGAGRRLYTPPVRPCTPAHPDGLRTTGNSAGRARCKADHAGTIGQGAGRWTSCNVSGKVYNFGRFILSIFIWTIFPKSIDNPYIYGYNIISPDKYGLQPRNTKTGGQKP